MNIEVAAAAVQEMFDVTDKRYPLATAILHVNQACRFLSNEFDVTFDRSYKNLLVSRLSVIESEGVRTMWRSVPTSVILSPDSTLEFDYARSVIYNPGEDDQTKLVEVSFEQIAEANLANAAKPTVYAVHGGTIYFAPQQPEPTQDYVIRVIFQGRARSIDSGRTNGWLTRGEFAAIYKTAELAAIYLLEDERVPMFKAMWMEEAKIVEAADSMRGYDEPMLAEEP